MLKFLRKNTRVIVWAVVIAFVTWGGYAARLQFDSANRTPGRIFGKDVSFREYLSAGQIVQLFYAPAKDKEPPSAGEVEAQTWQFLVLSREARRRKISVKDEQVRQEIDRLFGGEGALNLMREQYFDWIRKEFRREPREFEDQVRENLRVKKLLDETRKGFSNNPDEQMKNWLVQLIRKAHPEIYPARS